MINNKTFIFLQTFLSFTVINFYNKDINKHCKRLELFLMLKMENLGIKKIKIFQKSACLESALHFNKTDYQNLVNYFIAYDDKLLLFDIS